MVALFVVALLGLAVVAVALEAEGVAVACVAGVVCLVKYWS